MSNAYNILDIASGGALDVSYYRNKGTTLYGSGTSQYYGAGISANDTGPAAYTNNLLYFVPFISGQAGTIDKIGVNVTTNGTAAARVRLGVYTNLSTTNLYPVTRLLDSGEIDVSSNGWKEATISLSMLANTLYWFVYTANEAISLTSVALNSMLPILGMPVTADPVRRWQPVITLVNAFAALPTPVTSGAAQTQSSTFLTPLILVHYVS